MINLQPFIAFSNEVDKIQSDALENLIPRKHHTSEVFEKILRVGQKHGKHFRSELILLGTMLEDSDLDQSIVAQAGAAIELQHSAILIHDDIIDEDELRRGSPTLHKWFEDKGGIDSHASESIAIVAADWLFANGLQLFTDLKVKPYQVQRIFNILAEVGSITASGEIQDILTKEIGCTWSQAIENATKKTAYYSAIGPLRTGAILAEAADDGKRYEHLGLIMGEAFQLRDDLLGLFETSDAIGKSVASDIKKGRCTALLAAFLERADEGARAEYQDFVGKPLSFEDITRIKTLISESGAKDFINNHMNTLMLEAQTEIDKLNLPKKAKPALENLLQVLETRHI